MKKLLTTLMFACALIATTGLSTTAYAQTQAQTDQSTTQESQQLDQSMDAMSLDTADSASQTQDFFKARIVNITNESQEVSENGIKTYIQTYDLKPENGPWQNKAITVSDSEFNTIGLDAFKVGDVLLIAHTVDQQGQDQFAVIDYVRETSLYILAFLFVGLVILMGKMKGVKALVSLAISVTVIIWFILPQIVNGADPVLISVLGAIIITVISLYVTYGFKYFTHIGAASIGISLIFTVIVTEIFANWTKLTGNVDEQASNLLQMFGSNFNIKGILLAAFIIGAIGVLNDVVINQISLIEELYRANQNMTWKELFNRGLKVGVDHISAIVNTLFLAYVGAALPLLLLFAGDKISKYDYSTIINLEIITTEIVRTLTGSLGLILAVPISTFIAAVFIPKYFKKNQDVLKVKTTPHGHAHN